MNDTLKKLSEDTKQALIKSIASKAVDELILKTKSAEEKDSGTFKVIVSTDDIDRQGESVDQNGWDLSFYKSNPIVLWAHDYSTLPIGVTTSIEIVGNKLIAEGKFAPAEANPFAQQVRKLYDLGMVNTTSVGFIPKEYDEKEDNRITKSELLEFSFVPVPANPYAVRLSQIKTLGIDTAMLKTKGIEIKEEEEPSEPNTVSEEISEIEMREQKWNNYMKICEVMDAFCSVYFDEATRVDDFNKILGETISILAEIASETEETMVEKTKGIKSMIEKMLAGRKSVTIKEAIIAVIRNNLALGSLKLSDGDRKIESSKSTPSLEPSVNSFIEDRELLRSVDKSLEKVLQKFSIVARERGIK